MSGPTPPQADALRRAAEHPKGLVSCGTVVRRNLLEQGWIEKQTRTVPLHNRLRRTTTDFTSTVYVITDEGRAAIGAPVEALPDLDGAPS